MAKFRAPRTVALACLLAGSLTIDCADHRISGPDGVTKLTVTSIAPSTGPDAEATVATIYGQGFSSPVTVEVDGLVIPAVLQSATSIGVTMPAHPAGQVDIKVSTSSSTVTMKNAFEYRHIDPPVVTDTVPSAGAPDGFNTVKLVGTGFQAGAVVLFDGAVAEVVSFPPVGAPRTSTFISVWAPPHALGNVELAVRNPDGQMFRVPGGYTYAPSASFDFNGVWRGFAWETNAVISLTIENNVLVSVTCGSVTHTFSPTAVVVDGQFSISGPDGTMAGHVLSPNEATGTLAIAGCSSAFGWEAYK